MVRHLVALVITCLPLALCAQVTFDRGYYIDSHGNRVEGLIKNYDWKYNPFSIEFKSAVGSPVQRLDTSAFVEFAIENWSRYLKHRVRVDTTTDKVFKDNVVKNRLWDRHPSRERAPEWATRTLVLKVLFQGRVNLYSYENDDILRFFYDSHEGGPQQLVYKKYLADVFDQEMVMKNNDFRQQLSSLLNCNAKNVPALSRLSYTAKDLLKYFQGCNLADPAPKTTNIPGSRQDSTKRWLFKLKVGLDQFQTEINANFKYAIGPTLSLRVGTEFEYILPYERGNWSLFFEPAFQHYSGDSHGTTIKYMNLQFPFGMRWYALNRPDYALFVNYALAPNFPTSSSVSGPGFGGTIGYKMLPFVNHGFGAGFRASRLNIEFRTYTNLPYSNENGIVTKISCNSIILGYRLGK